jgi:hypothetical protein
MYYLCGDKFVEYFKDKPVYRYYQYGLLKVQLVVTSGWKALVVDNNGEEITFNCRWDMQDTYFKLNAKKIDDVRIQLTKESIVSILSDSSIAEIYEDPKNRKEFVYLE